MPAASYLVDICEKERGGERERKLYCHLFIFFVCKYHQPVICNFGDAKLIQIFKILLIVLDNSFA